MKIIPAIDIKGGKVVRLLRGDMRKVTVYSDSPLEIAKKWDSYGVETIHVVDLDGALGGELVNFEIVKGIASTINARIEMGGGIRDIETMEKVLDAGIDSVVIGTRAIESDFIKRIPKTLKPKVIVGIDAKNGFVYTKGWVINTDISVADLTRKLERDGIAKIIYTDISKDGMMKGPDAAGLKKLLDETSLDVVASGGISNISDIIKLKTLEPDGLCAVIVGKALYENTLDLEEAIRVA